MRPADPDRSSVSRQLGFPLPPGVGGMYRSHGRKKGGEPMAPLPRDFNGRRAGSRYEPEGAPASPPTAASSRSFSSSLVVAWNLSFLWSSSPSTSTTIVSLPVKEP